MGDNDSRSEATSVLLHSKIHFGIRWEKENIFCGKHQVLFSCGAFHISVLCLWKVAKNIKVGEPQCVYHKSALSLYLPTFIVLSLCISEDCSLKLSGPETSYLSYCTAYTHRRARLFHRKPQKNANKDFDWQEKLFCLSVMSWELAQVWWLLHQR